MVDGVTVRYLSSDDSEDIKPGETGVMISVPSECAPDGTAYVAFIEKGGRPVSLRNAEHAAYALASFNGELDRLKEYRTSIVKAAFSA